LKLEKMASLERGSHKKVQIFRSADRRDPARSRQVIGWSMQSRIDSEPAINAFMMASGEEIRKRR
jgi:hypothetical protein